MGRVLRSSLLPTHTIVPFLRSGFLPLQKQCRAPLTVWLSGRHLLPGWAGGRLGSLKDLKNRQRPFAAGRRMAGVEFREVFRVQAKACGLGVLAHMGKLGSLRNGDNAG